MAVAAGESCGCGATDEARSAGRRSGDDRLNDGPAQVQFGLNYRGKEHAPVRGVGPYSRIAARCSGAPYPLLLAQL